MDWNSALTSFTTLLVALGGFEFVKFLVNRKAHKKQAQAEADKTEEEVHSAFVDTVGDQYKFLQEMIQGLQKQNNNLMEENESMRKEMSALKDKVNAFENGVRDVARDFNSYHKETKRVIALMTSRKNVAEMHYCSVEKCASRRPPMGQYHTEDLCAPDPIVDFEGFLNKDKATDESK